jgi:hypothetical protein
MRLDYDDTILNKDSIEKHRVEMSSKYRKLFDRVVAGEASPRDAIKLQCLECWGYDRSETQLCDHSLCPLYQYRPYQKPVKSPTEAVKRDSVNKNTLKGDR